MKYLVFLDIDGVFTSNRVHVADNCRGGIWNKFDPVAVEFVLISTWRNYLPHDNVMILHWIQSAFTNAGFRGDIRYPQWKVNSQEDIDLYHKERAWEIKDYLENHADGYLDYIIFDDSDYRFKEVLGISRHVKTHPDDGILFKHMLNAKSIMGNWDKK